MSQGNTVCSLLASVKGHTENLRVFYSQYFVCFKVFVSKNLVGTRYHLAPGKLGSFLWGNTFESRQSILLVEGVDSDCSDQWCPWLRRAPCFPGSPRVQTGIPTERWEGVTALPLRLRMGRGSWPGRKGESPALGAESSERSDSWPPACL